MAYVAGQMFGPEFKWDGIKPGGKLDPHIIAEAAALNDIEMDRELENETATETERDREREREKERERERDRERSTASEREIQRKSG